MKFLVQVICVSEAVERREQVSEMEREHLTAQPTPHIGLCSIIESSSARLMSGVS